MATFDYAEDSEGELPHLSLEAEQAKAPAEPPKPTRPRPRPIKKKQPDNSIPDSQALPDRIANSSLDSFADIYAGPSSIADRAKTRERNSRKQTQPTPPAVDVLELTSDDGYDELFSSQPKPKKTKAKAKAKSAKPIRAREPSPYVDPIYGTDAIPPTFPDAPMPSAPPAPLSNPYSIPPTPFNPSPNEDDGLPPIATLPQDYPDNDTLSPKSTASGPTPFFAPSSSSVPFPATLNDSGIADVSATSSHSKKSRAMEQDVDQPPPVTKKPSTAKGKNKDVVPTNKKPKKSKRKDRVIFTDDEDELNSNIPLRPVVEIQTRVPSPKKSSPKKPLSSSSSKLSSVPPSDHEVELEVPKPARKRKAQSDEEDFAPAKKPKKAAQKKAKAKRVVSSDDEGDSDPPPPPKVTKKNSTKAAPKAKAKAKPKGKKLAEAVVEETQPAEAAKVPEPPAPRSPTPPQPEEVASTPPAPRRTVSSTPLSRSGSVIPRKTSTPMSELIRKVNSQPGSVFASSPVAKSGGNTLAYSPYAKASRTMLSRIAPLHPNRKPPPPPLPPPPPRRKTKKELEREERWEEELIESAGGIEQWVCLSDEERKEMRRAKREMEMAGWED